MTLYECKFCGLGVATTTHIEDKKNALCKACKQAYAKGYEKGHTDGWNERRRAATIEVKQAYEKGKIECLLPQRLQGSAEQIEREAYARGRADEVEVENKGHEKTINFYINEFKRLKQEKKQARLATTKAIFAELDEHISMFCDGKGFLYTQSIAEAKAVYERIKKKHLGGDKE